LHAFVALHVDWVVSGLHVPSRQRAPGVQSAVDMHAPQIAVVCPSQPHTPSSHAPGPTPAQSMSTLHCLVQTDPEHAKPATQSAFTLQAAHAVAVPDAVGPASVFPALLLLLLLLHATSTANGALTKRPRVNQRRVTLLCGCIAAHSTTQRALVEVHERDNDRC